MGEFNWSGIIGLVLGGVITWFVNRRLNQSTIKLNESASKLNESSSELNEANTINVSTETIVKLIKQVNDLVISDTENKKRISHLESELERYMKAYGKLWKFTSTHIPDVEIPDFLLDTQPKIKPITKG